MSACSTKNSSMVNKLRVNRLFIIDRFTLLVPAGTTLPTVGRRSLKGNSTLWFSWARNGSLRSRSEQVDANRLVELDQLMRDLRNRLVACHIQSRCKPSL